MAQKKYKVLTDIPVGKAAQAQQAALMRLQLFFTGQTHEMIGQVARVGAKALAKEAGADGKLDAGGLLRAERKITDAWEKMFTEEWLPMFERMRMQAASIPVGRMAIYHEMFLVPNPDPFLKGREKKVEEALYSGGPVFEPQLRQLVDEAAKFIYQDGLDLSSRIWKLDRATREGINKVLLRGITDGKSAWELAKELEGFLGAGMDCPKWTSTRLYKLTKKDIASGDRRGLKTGEECDGKGTAYNALRMARTEIQRAHHLANDAMMASMPWVEKEQIVLSPAHPKPDICDDVISAGEGGQGIYPKGTIGLPLHPHCLCYKVTVLMDDEVFADRLKGWVNGTQGWVEMDAYQKWLGVEDVTVSLADNTAALALLVWLQGGMDDLFRAAGLT